MNPEVPFISSAGEEMLSVSREAMNDTEAKMLARGKRLEWVGDTDTLRHVVAAPFEFGSEAMRSLAKTAVHATADFFGERAALGASQSRRLRNLALGLPDALAGLVVWDYASAEMASEPFYHGVEATACPTTGILSVRVHVYGLWRVRFLVSDTYRGRLHSVRTRITDPIGDSQRVTPTRCRHPIPWLTMRERGPAYRDLRARAYLATHGSMFESATLTNLNRFERPEEWGRPPI